MPTNHDAIKELLDSKKALEAQVNAGATGSNLDNLGDAIKTIGNEVRELVLQGLEDNYVPQSDAFKAVTAQAKAFVGKLKAIENAFKVLNSVVSAVTTVLKYVI